MFRPKLLPFIMVAAIMLLTGSGSQAKRSPACIGPDILPSAQALRSSPITVTPDGRLLLVVNRDSASLSVLDTRTLTLLAEIPVGDSPQTVSANVQGRKAYVTGAVDGTVTEVDLCTAKVTRTWDVGLAPFGVLAAPDGRLFTAVTGSDRLVVIDLASQVSTSIETAPWPRGLALSADGATLYITHFQTGQISALDTATLTLAQVMEGAPQANIAQALVLDPRGERAYLPHSLSQTDREPAAVAPVVSVLDLVHGAHEAVYPVPMTALPIDAVLTPDGRLALVSAGTDEIALMDLATGAGAGRISVGSNPRGIALSPDGQTAYVNNTLDGTITVIDMETGAATATAPVTAMPLAPNILNGKRLFNNAADGRLSRENGMSCASCHWDGGSDGRVWLMQDGLRKTPTLLGSKDTAPYHWAGDFDELEDVEFTIRHLQGGTGLAPGPDHCDPACNQGPPNSGRSRDLENLAAYMRILTFPPPKEAPLEPAVASGQALFLSDRTSCYVCHAPPLYTDRQRHNIGTGGTFDTPSLRGLGRTAPYLHDGRAPTLLDLLTTHNQGDRHGITSGLTPQELADLIAFLRTVE